MRSKVFSLLLLLPALAEAQYYNISTIAGNGKFQFTAGLQATAAHLVEPRLVTADAAGNFYVSDTYYAQVYQIPTPAEA